VSILVWGIATDSPTEAVLGALRRLKADIAFVDQTSYSDIDVDVAADPTVSGSIRLKHKTFRLDTIEACFLRPQDFRRLTEMQGRGRNDPAWQHAMTVEDRLLSWTEVTNSLVINRPSDMSSNNSKPYQAEIIRASGFATPETLITTDADAVSEFWRTHRDVVYKSISGIRSIVRRLDDAIHRARLPNVANCPTQFQQYIHGTDWRVHVVGEQVFACEIISKADDYRYAAQQGFPVEIRARPLEEDLVARCVALAKQCRLVVAGLDLRRTLAGEWYCFEVNPAPGFTYYQAVTGEPIDDAIAKVLTSRRKMSVQ
jgi:glutathione synthase/RimK-type ligase-like ATP-grasp enzyme